MGTAIELAIILALDESGFKWADRKRGLPIVATAPMNCSSSAGIARTDLLPSAAAAQHNAHTLRTPKHRTTLLFNTTRARAHGSTGVAIAMDGGMADTACYDTGR